MPTYTIEQVAEALDVRKSDVDYLLYSFRLLLASDAPGRLNTRQFPLIDIYILGLTLELIRLSGRREQMCRAVEHFLWWTFADSEDMIREFHGKPKLTPAERVAMREARAVKYAADHTTAGECFKPRDGERPYFLIGYDDLDGKVRLRTYEDDAIWHTGFLGLRGLWIVNVTRLMFDIDRRLAEVA
jgi:hypothetical protein